MTDLAPGDAATRSCPVCGVQNDLGATTCEHCGSPLDDDPTGRDAERGDLDVVEVARSVVALGYDVEFDRDAGSAGDAWRCPMCSATFELDETAVASRQPAVDTAAGGVPMEVVTASCPSCGAQGHAVVPVPDSE